jgi:hypothetical protein
MPHRGYRVKEARGSVIGGATTNILIAGVDEAAHNSGKEEDILGAVHSTTADHCTPG